MLLTKNNNNNNNVCSVYLMPLIRLRYKKTVKPKCSSVATKLPKTLNNCHKTVRSDTFIINEKKNLFAKNVHFLRKHNENQSCIWTIFILTEKKTLKILNNRNKFYSMKIYLTKQNTTNPFPILLQTCHWKILLYFHTLLN